MFYFCICSNKPDLFEATCSIISQPNGMGLSLYKTYKCSFFQLWAWLHKLPFWTDKAAIFLVIWAQKKFDNINTFQHFLSPIDNGGIRTLDPWIICWAPYLSATRAQPMVIDWKQVCFLKEDISRILDPIKMETKKKIYSARFPFCPTEKTKLIVTEGH